MGRWVAVREAPVAHPEAVVEAAACRAVIHLAAWAACPVRMAWLAVCRAWTLAWAAEWAVCQPLLAVVLPRRSGNVVVAASRTMLRCSPRQHKSNSRHWSKRYGVQ